MRNIYSDKHLPWCERESQRINLTTRFQRCFNVRCLPDHPLYTWTESWASRGGTWAVAQPWNLKTMTSYVVFVQYTPTVLLVTSTLASNSLKLGRKNRRVVMLPPPSGKIPAGAREQNSHAVRDTPVRDLCGHMFSNSRSIPSPLCAWLSLWFLYESNVLIYVTVI